jgi:hypothetical protein
MRKQSLIKEIWFRLSFFIFVVLGFFPRLAFPACIDDICFSDKTVIATENLVLEGVGLLEYLKFDMYAAAFYLPQNRKKIATEDVLDPSISKKLVIHYKRDIKVSWMNKAAERIIKKNPTIDYPSVESRVKEIGDAYIKVEKGDRYALSYDAEGQRTTLLLNDQKVTEISGGDFARAYFGIWISEYSANQELRAKLLNLD